MYEELQSKMELASNSGQDHYIRQTWKFRIQKIKRFLALSREGRRAWQASMTKLAAEWTAELRQLGIE